ncbi:Tryptophan--tRNA ligase, mitochondrial [Elasticomyces elasticus]|nr:Tryptophan--tRNA ligase, mitochondrial [Elasticomyces elasticus]
MGYLSRMTQWKSKLDLPDNANPLDPSSKTRLKLGLFSYPVLQAADILVHRATHVPVGHDQSQHLEFARDCADGFNHVYGKVLVPPNTLLSPAKKVMALDRPQLKMSKSHPNPKSRILLTDSEQEIRKKVAAALTDSIDGVSYDPAQRPGVSNLVDLMYHLEEPNWATPQSILMENTGLSLKAFKSLVATVIDKHLEPIRSRYEKLMYSGAQRLEHATLIGEEKAKKSADGTMRVVRNAMGL